MSTKLFNDLLASFAHGQVAVSRLANHDDDECECVKNDWSYFCDECIEKQARIAHEYKFSDPSGGLYE